MSGKVTDFSVATATTDGAFEQKETTWSNADFSKYLGYYNVIPELKTAIDTKATWTVGKGFIADEETTLILDSIKGWGKDTFNTLLENAIRVYYIGGDSYSEIIRDEFGALMNLKPLDPAMMVHIVDNQGKLIRFEQKSKVKGKKAKRFEPEEIFYLPRNRKADEIHGNSIIEALETIILMRNEAMDDWKTVLHRNVVPVRIIEVDTDDTTKIASIRADYEDAIKKKEVIVIPKGTVEIKDSGIAPNATMNPLPWIEALNNYFFQAVGVPQIIVGGVGAITEAAVKIAYLAFQQTIEEEQLFIEEQVLSQLNLVIELEFPASLENELLSDKAKDKETGAAQPNDTTAETEGRK